MYLAKITKTRASTSTRSSDLVTLVFEADPNWLFVTVLFSKTNKKNHEYRSTVDYIDGRREKVGLRHTAVFRWKKNESTWITEMEMDGMGDGCAVLLRLHARKIQVQGAGMQCVRGRGNGAPLY